MFIKELRLARKEFTTKSDVIVTAILAKVKDFFAKTRRCSEPFLAKHLAFHQSSHYIHIMPPRKKEVVLLEILDTQEELDVDIEKVRTVCERILNDNGIKNGKLNVVLVDSGTIQQYNRDFLQHDYPTDSISFPIEDRRNEGYLEGEVLVCTEIARERAKEFGWTAEEELLLYVVHGMLHLTGFDDITPAQQTVMQKKEREYLATLGIQTPKWNWDDWK